VLASRPARSNPEAAQCPPALCPIGLSPAAPRQRARDRWRPRASGDSLPRADPGRWRGLRLRGSWPVRRHGRNPVPGAGVRIGVSSAKTASAARTWASRRGPGRPRSRARAGSSGRRSRSQQAHAKRGRRIRFTMKRPGRTVTAKPASPILYRAV